MRRVETICEFHEPHSGGSRHHRVSTELPPWSRADGVARKPLVQTTLSRCSSVCTCERIITGFRFTSSRHFDFQPRGPLLWDHSIL